MVSSLGALEKKNLLWSCFRPDNHRVFPATRFRRNLSISQKLAGMQQKVAIRTESGKKLAGVLHETGSTNVVVLCHGFRSSKESKNMVSLACALEKEGISAFRFDFAGNGESEGSFQYGNYFSEVEDLRSVIEYFSGLKRKMVAVVGHSKGGNVVLLYASKYHDVGAVINISGRYDLNQGIEERLGGNYMERIERDGYIEVESRGGDYLVTKASLLERLSTKMHDACLSIDKDCRVLTVHGSADEIIRVEDATEFARLIPNHRLKIIEGADHGYSFHQEELASVILSFIKELLETNQGC